jgi:hypothetical protein
VGEAFGNILEQMQCKRERGKGTAAVKLIVRYEERRGEE